MKFDDMKVGQWFRTHTPELVEVCVKTTDRSFFSFTSLDHVVMHSPVDDDRCELISVTAVRATAIIEINQPEAG